MATARKRLGRGLNALIQEQPASSKESSVTEEVSSGVQTVPLKKVVVSPWQPRKEFSEDALEELSVSIKEHGILQPLLVREVDGKYELIAGERRFRAASKAKLKEVPVLIKEVTDKEALELALIENLQREDLNIIEEAKGYRLLGDEFDLTQEEIADRVGKGRATVANALRLLELPPSIQTQLSEQKISQGHAKVLLGVDIEQEQILLSERIINEQLSVRKLESIVKNLRNPKTVTTGVSGSADISKDHLRHLTDELHHILGTSVRITSSKTLENGKKSKGGIEIDYYSTEDLNRILSLMGYEEESL
jgi:ParB family chromosome partitioning protein